MPIRWPRRWTWFGVAARRAADEALRASEAKFAAAFALSPQAISITALPSGNFVEVNEALLRLTGYRREELLGRTPLELGLWVDEGDWARGREILAREGRLPQSEVRFRRKDGDIIVGLAAAERIVVAGQPAILTVIADLTARKQAEEGLQRSEERYRTLVESVDQGVCLFEMLYGPDGRPCDYRFLEVNPPFERHTGLKGAVGRTARELVPDLEDQWVETYGRVAETGIPYRFEQGSAAMGRWFEVEAVRVGGAGSRTVALLFNDVSDRKQADAALRAEAERSAFRAALSDALRPLTDPGAIQDEAARLLGQYLGTNRIHYGEIGDDGQITIERCYADGVAPIVGRFPIDNFGPARKAAPRTGRTLVVPDVAASPDLPPDERAVYAQFSIAAIVGVPLVKDGRFVATIAVHHATPRAWTTDEVALIEETAERTWAALERARTEAALRESEYRLRIASEAANVGIYDYDVASNRVLQDDTIRQVWGIGPDEEVTFETFAAGLHPADRAAAELAVARAVDPAGDGRYEAEYRVIHRGDGSVRWIAATGQVFFEEGRALRLIGTAQDISARRQAEDRIAFLGEVSALLAGLLDETLALAALARLLVRDLAEGCLIGTLEEDGLVHRRALAHADPAREALLRQLPTTYPYDPAQPQGATSVIASGRSRFSPVLTAAELGAGADFPERPIYQALAVTSVMVVPLRARGGTFGAISLFRAAAARIFDEADLALAEQIAERAAVALDGARLYAAERAARAVAERVARRQAALVEATRLLAESGPALEPLLAATARYLTDSLGDGCVIGLVAADGARIELAAADHRDAAAAEFSRRAFAAEPLRVGVGVIGGTALTGKAVLLPAVDTARLIAESEPGLRPVLKRYTPYSLMVAPCRAGGRTIGVIALARQTPDRPYTASDLALLGDLADRAALAIERARLYEAERLAREAAETAQGRVALLAEAGITLANSLDEATTLSALADLIVPAFADWCTINLLGDDDGLRPPIAVHRDPARQGDLDALLRRYPADPRGAGPVARVLRSGESVLQVAPPDELLRAHAPDDDYLTLLARIGLTATIIVPLLARQRLLGALRFARMGASRPYDGDDLRLGEELARRAALALDNARLYRESRDAVAARDRFLSIAAHELRTPVTSMRAYAQLARRQRDRGQLTPEAIASALNAVERGTARLNTLIQDLLDVARLQAGQLRVERVALDLAELVRTVVAEARAQLPAGLRLTVTGAKRPYPIDADAGRLEQVLGNLLENARKYSPDGGTIAVSLTADEGGATIAVRDEGIGLAPGEAQTIFTPFSRSEEAQQRQIQGLGLGLAICRAIIAEHGGTLEAASEGTGRGTVFTLWLPATRVGVGALARLDGAAGVEA